MDFEFSSRMQELRQQLLGFMEEHIYTNDALFQAQVDEGDRWEPPAILEDLKRARRFPAR